jgi:hypothetical protein
MMVHPVSGEGGRKEEEADEGEWQWRDAVGFCADDGLKEAACPSICPVDLTQSAFEASPSLNL